MKTIRAWFSIHWRTGTVVLLPIVAISGLIIYKVSAQSARSAGTTTDTSLSQIQMTDPLTYSRVYLQALTTNELQQHIDIVHDILHPAEAQQMADQNKTADQLNAEAVSRDGILHPKTVDEVLATKSLQEVQQWKAQEQAILNPSAK